MAKTWTPSEVSYLKRYGTHKTPEELAQRFETDTGEVLLKLRDLGLAAQEGGLVSHDDPALSTFDEALRALHKGKWKVAAPLFEKVAADSEQLEVRARARQYLQVCRSRLEEAPASGKEDPYLLAVVLKNRGELSEALEIASKKTDDERFVYLSASIHALEEREEEARKALEQAVRLNPKNRVHAFHDPDFASLRGKEDYAHLFGLA